MITDIEDFFAKGCGRCDRFATPACSANQWHDGLTGLRAICRSAGLVETVKSVVRVSLIIGVGVRPATEPFAQLPREQDESLSGDEIRTVLRGEKVIKNIVDDPAPDSRRASVPSSGRPMPPAPPCPAPPPGSRCRASPCARLPDRARNPAPRCAWSASP